jgi:hypothetical protein
LNSTITYSSFELSERPWVKAVTGFIVGVLFLPSLLRSQDSIPKEKVECGDIITFKNETTQKAKIYEVNVNEIVFKRCANLNGPIIRISKSNIKSIVYLNGTKESFEKFVPVVEEYQVPIKVATVDQTVNLKALKRMRIDTNYHQNKVFYTDRTKHFISTDIFNLIFFQLPSLSYERILLNGKFGIRGLAAIGFRQSKLGGEIPFMKENVKQSFGIDLNYYLREGNFYPGPIKPFFSASFEYGVFSYTDETKTFIRIDSTFSGTPPTLSSTNYIYEYTRQRREGYQFTWMVKGGLLLRPAKHFNISLVAGIGKMSFNRGYTHQDRGIVKAEINMGYKF